MYRYVRKYAGPLKACILDWSGTTADKYVIAPAVIIKTSIPTNTLALDRAKSIIFIYYLITN